MPESAVPTAFGRRRHSLVVALACVALASGWLAAGCRSEDKPGAAPSSSAPSPSPPSESSAADEEAFELELMELTLTSAVVSKDPKDVLVQTAPGERVYAHLTVRNRTGETQKVVLDFAVNGHERTHLELDVQPSWSWRTWGYNTVLKTDEPGELELVVQHDGLELSRATLPIGEKVRTRPVSAVVP